MIRPRCDVSINVSVLSDAGRLMCNPALFFTFQQTYKVTASSMKCFPQSAESSTQSGFIMKGFYELNNLE